MAVNGASRKDDVHKVILRMSANLHNIFYHWPFLKIIDVHYYVIFMAGDKARLLLSALSDNACYSAVTVDGIQPSKPQTNHNYHQSFSFARIIST